MKKIIIPLVAILYSIAISIIWSIYALFAIICTLFWDFKFPNFYYRASSTYIISFESCFGYNDYYYKSYFHYIWNIKRK